MNFNHHSSKWPPWDCKNCASR